MSDADTTLDYTMIALADPTRRAILEQLFAGEARVTDVARPFAMSLNSVSKHIKILERAGLVHRRRAGRDHFLSFNPQPLKEAMRWLGGQRDKWSTDLDRFAALMNEDAARRKWALPWIKN